MIQHLFNKHPIGQVFTPSTTAQLGFVPRYEIQDTLARSLRIPGRQIVLFGQSGGGKTTLLTKTLAVLRQSAISSSCTSTTTVDHLLLDAFDQLNTYYVDTISDTHSKSQERTRLRSYKAQYIEISNSIKQTESLSRTAQRRRVVPLQLSPQRLAEFLGAAGQLWIIEDFHKASEGEKKKLAQILKVFMDMAQRFPQVRIICVGAVGTARELVTYDPELSNRISEIHVPLFSVTELQNLIHHGSGLLNISLEDDIKEKIVHYSNHLAAVCHQLCYDMCDSRGIASTRFIRVGMTNEDFNGAVTSYVKNNSDTFDKILDKAFRQRQARYESSKLILRAFFEEDHDVLSFNQIYRFISKKHRRYPRTRLSSYLKLLTTSEYSEVLRYDRNARKYAFSNPFLRAYAKMKFALETQRTQKKDYSLSVELKIDQEFLASYLKVMEDSSRRIRTIRTFLGEHEAG